MSENILVSLTPAEQSIIRQALRAERDRMVKQGFARLAHLAGETSNKIADAVLDNKIVSL